MDMDKLIAEVFMRPTLWDKKDANHHNRFILDKLWDEVAYKLKSTRKTVRYKWKALRDKFRTTLASLPKQKSSIGADTSHRGLHWKHFDSLLFLKDQFTPKSSSGQFLPEAENDLQHESENSYSIDESDNELKIMSLNSCETYVASENLKLDSKSRPENSSKSKDAKQRTTETESTQLEIEARKYKYLEGTRQEDDDLNFFKSIIPHIKNLSSIEKIAYRVKIMQVTGEFLKSRTDIS